MFRLSVWQQEDMESFYKYSKKKCNISFIFQHIWLLFLFLVDFLIFVCSSFKLVIVLLFSLLLVRRLDKNNNDNVLFFPFIKLVCFLFTKFSKFHIQNVLSKTVSNVIFLPAGIFFLLENNVMCLSFKQNSYQCFTFNFNIPCTM
jgi:hypothetical protein